MFINFSAISLNNDIYYLHQKVVIEPNLDVQLVEIYPQFRELFDENFRYMNIISDLVNQYKEPKKLFTINDIDFSIIRLNYKIIPMLSSSKLINPIRIKSIEEFKSRLFNVASFLITFDLQKNNMLLAGGSVCCLTMGFDIKQSDYDIFLIGQSNHLESIINLSIHLKSKLNNLKLFRTINCITMTGVDENGTHIIQVILRQFKTPADVLYGFDLDIAAIGWTGNDLIMSSRGLFGVQYCANILDLRDHRSSYEHRVEKYFSRGVDLIIPLGNIAKIKERGLSKFTMIWNDNNKLISLLANTNDMDSFYCSRNINYKSITSIDRHNIKCMSKSNIPIGQLCAWTLCGYPNEKDIELDLLMDGLNGLQLGGIQPSQFNLSNELGNPDLNILLNPNDIFKIQPKFNIKIIRNIINSALNFKKGIKTHILVKHIGITLTNQLIQCFLMTPDLLKSKIEEISQLVKISFEKLAIIPFNILTEGTKGIDLDLESWIEGSTELPNDVDITD